MKKDFKYLIREKSTGKIIVEEIVSFGNSNYPFPKKWKDNGAAMSALENYRESIIHNHFVISYEELEENDEKKENGLI